jgi:hypothetical protein
VTVTVIDQPVTREGDPVCVATEIAEYRRRAGEGLLRIHDPRLRRGKVNVQASGGESAEDLYISE